MKLRNKKTGEIVEAGSIYFEGQTKIHYSLAELNEEWEDYEEPKEIYYVNYKGHIMTASPEGNWDDEKAIGNYFETKEEAEKALEKLKAWKRLKDKGFRFDRWMEDDDSDFGLIILASYSRANIKEDLDLLFGGEE